MTRPRPTERPQDLERVLSDIGVLADELHKEVRSVHNVCYSKTPTPAPDSEHVRTSGHTDPTGAQATGNVSIKHHYHRAAASIHQAKTELLRVQEAFSRAVAAADSREDNRDPTGSYGRPLAPPMVSKKELERLRRKQQDRKAAGME